MRKEGKSLANSLNKVGEEIHIGAEGVVEQAVVNVVDSLIPVKFTLDGEERVVECLARTELVNQPEVSLVFDAVVHHAKPLLFCT